MARYREIADDLRRRIQAEEFPVGSKLPSISTLQEEYVVPSLGTIRGAHQVLEEEGMVESRQGVGVFVISTTSLRQVNVLDTVAKARDLLNTVEAALKAPNHSVVIDLYENDETAFVLTEALRDWAHRHRGDAEDEPEGDPRKENLLAWAAEAERLAQLVDDKL